ncbi:MAG: ester cyclase [Candidatus Bipolaricaulia bacterium]
MNRWFGLLTLAIILMMLTTAALAQTPTTYQVKERDSLWRIAEQFYGDGTLWTVIAEANGIRVANPRGLRIGESLIIPKRQAEENKVIYRRFAEQVINGGNLDALDDLVVTDFVDHSAPSGLSPGIAGMKQLFTIFQTAFPNLHSTIEDLVAEGDKVVARVTTRGTHRGVFLGIPPTGRRFTITEIHIYRIVDSKIVEHWGVADSLGLMQQLGVIPPPGRGGR